MARLVRVTPEQKVRLKLTPAQRTLLVEALICLPKEYEQILQTTPATQPVMLTLDELEDLGGYVAAEANHATDSKLQKKLDAVFEKIERVLDTHTVDEPPKSLKFEDAQRAKLIVGQTVAVAEYAAKALVAAEQLGIKSKSIARFPLPASERALLATLSAVAPPLKRKLTQAYLSAQHAAGRLPVTIVRPSHTNRVNFPGTFISGDHIAWRMLHSQPVVSHGDGSGLWVLTRSEDFGAAFARLLGNPQTLGEAFHITSDEANAWDRLFAAIADALGVEANLVHVATDTLIQYNAAWESGLRGDKAWSVQFDNSKIKQAVDGWACRYSMCDAMQMAAPHVRRRMQGFQPDFQVDALVDRIVAEQRALK